MPDINVPTKAYFPVVQQATEINILPESTKTAVAQPVTVAQVIEKLEKNNAANAEIFEILYSEMDRFIAKLDALIEKLDRYSLPSRIKHQASDFNSRTRIRNLKIRRATGPLKPLCHHLTGDQIPLFPENLDAINRMDGEALDALLTALGETTGGRIPVRRIRLRRAVGAINILSG